MRIKYDRAQTFPSRSTGRRPRSFISGDTQESTPDL